MPTRLFSDWKGQRHMMMAFACQVDFACRITAAGPSARPLFPDVPTVLPWPTSNLSLPLIDGAKTHVTFIVGVATQLMTSNTRYFLELYNKWYIKKHAWKVTRLDTQLVLTVLHFLVELMQRIISLILSFSSKKETTVRLKNEKKFNNGGQMSLAHH